jgi:hypothetical protein
MTTNNKRLLVTACGVHAAWSDNAVALAAALECGHGAIRLSDEVPSGRAAARTWMAPIPRWQGQSFDYSERLLSMLEHVLEHISQYFPASMERIDECLLVLPPASTTRGEFLDSGLLQAGLAGCCGNGIAVRLMREAGGVYGCLAQLSNNGISTGRAKLVIVADSLIHAPSLFELAQQRLLQTEFDADGICPGEASVALVVEQDQGQPQPQALIGIEQVPVPAANETVFRKAVKQAMSAAGWEPGDIDALFVCSGETMHEQLAWYEVRESLWQHEVSEQDRVAMMLGESDSLSSRQPLVSEYFPHLVAGNTGIAAPALALAMIIGQVTAERQLSRFGHEPGRRMLVCGGDAYAGGLCVVPGLVDVPQIAAQSLIQPGLPADQPGIR